MSILLPVNPPYAGMLVDGKKTVEWRKKPLPTGTAYIYETKKHGGGGMVIGKVYILRSTKEDVGDLFGKMYDQFSTVPDIMNFLKEGKISKEDLVKYGNGNSVYACECCEAFKFITPLPLNRFWLPCNWKYDCCTCKLWNPDKYEAFCKRAEPLTRPPQSWCYVEDWKGESK